MNHLWNDTLDCVSLLPHPHPLQMFTRCFDDHWWALPDSIPTLVNSDYLYLSLTPPFNRHLSIRSPNTLFGDIITMTDCYPRYAMNFLNSVHPLSSSFFLMLEIAQICPVGTHSSCFFFFSWHVPINFLTLPCFQVQGNPGSYWILPAQNLE